MNSISELYICQYHLKQTDTRGKQTFKSSFVFKEYYTAFSLTDHASNKLTKKEERALSIVPAHCACVSQFLEEKLTHQVQPKTCFLLLQGPALLGQLVLQYL